jgi:predicted dehydrogenase
MKIRLAIIGNGHQVRGFHFPYIRDERKDVDVSWVSGCTCTPIEIPGCPLKAAGLVEHCAEGTHLNDWKELLETNCPDAVIIATPNSTHEEMIRSALAAGVHVAVDKPPTLSSAGCRELVDLARQKNRVFLTISQRRYEAVFQAMKRRIEAGDLGEMRLINYFAAHSFGATGWRRRRSVSGGGILIDTAYQGIDTILWLLENSPQKIRPVWISADWILDSSEPDPKAQVELFASVRIVMSNGCIFNITASYENPKGSVDETIKMFGARGALRYVRDKLVSSKDRSAGTLTFQRQTGESFVDHDGQSRAMRWAPLKDFLDAIAAGRTTVLSPAADSVPVLQIIEAAYKSAANSGIPINYIS